MLDVSLAVQQAAENSEEASDDHSNDSGEQGDGEAQPKGSKAQAGAKRSALASLHAQPPFQCGRGLCACLVIQSLVCCSCEATQAQASGGQCTALSLMEACWCTMGQAHAICWHVCCLTELSDHSHCLYNVRFAGTWAAAHSFTTACLQEAG